MKFLPTLRFSIFILLLGLGSSVFAQTQLRGIVLDTDSKDPLIGVSILVGDTGQGTITDWDGTFILETSESFPITLEFSYIGYETQTLEITDDSRINMTLSENAVTIEGVEVKGSRISDKQKESPLPIEALDIIGI